MACVLITAGEAVIAAVAAKAVESREKKTDNLEVKIPFSRKLKWLKNLLWGGSALLLFEHVWHGEITPWFPFLTAAGSAENTALMLHEMVTVGVAMAAVVTAVWVGMVLVSNAMEKRAHKENETPVSRDIA